jgi:Flp pilus assembly pilin Flp
MSQVSARFMSCGRIVATQIRRCAPVVLRSRDRAQDLVEYGVAVAVIAVVALAAIQAFGGGIGALFTRLLGRFSGLG